MIETIQKTKEYLNYIEHHYYNIQKAWKLINDSCKHSNFEFITDTFKWNLINDDVKCHDYSKLSHEEFIPYRKYYFPTNSEIQSAEKQGISYKLLCESEFNKAVAHHKQVNKHHWENWTKDVNTEYADAYLIMNMVDWIAMGFAFKSNAQEYYEKNKHTINLPEWAVKMMYEVFYYIYNSKIIK